MASHFDQHALNNAPASDAAFDQDLQAEQPQEVVATRPPTGFDFSKFLRKRYGMPRLSDLPRGKALWMALWQEVKDNWKSGITVSLVNVPLSISLAVASDADPVMGIVTAVWAVLFGAPLAGSNYNIVGPTGALSGLLSAYSIRYGEAVLPLLALMTGFMSLVVFFFRLDRFFSLIPNAVTHGFTVGVAFIIGLNQLASALGLIGLKRHEEFLMNMYEIFSHMGETNGWALVTFLIFLTALLTLARKFPKIPWVIVMCTLGIIIGALIDSGNWFFTVQTLHSKYPTLDLVLAKIPDFKAEMFNLETVFAASSVTLIAVLETLISAKIADRMTDTKHDRPREVLGVALANLGCGIFGGLPATAALARTALNIKSGATSRMSTIINGFMVMIIAVGLLSLFKYLMMPTVAAVLVVVAIRMVDPQELHHLWERDKTMAGIAFLTALLCVVLEPTTGIVIGAMISLLFFALQSGTGYGDVSVQRGHEILYSKSIYEIDALTSKLDVDQAAVPRMEEFEAAGSAGACLVYRITGSIVYLNAESHLERVLNALQDYQVVVMSLDSLYFLDIDGMEMLGDVATACTKGNKELVVAGVSNVVLEDLARLPWFVERQQKGMVFASTHEALEYLEHADQMGESGAVYGSAHPTSVQYYDSEEPNVQPASMNDDEANYP